MLTDGICRRLHPHVHEPFTSRLLATTGVLKLSMSGANSPFAVDVLRAIHPERLILRTEVFAEQLWSVVDVNRLRIIHLEILVIPSEHALALFGRCSSTLTELNVDVVAGGSQGPASHDQLSTRDLPRFTNLKIFRCKQSGRRAFDGPRLEWMMLRLVCLSPLISLEIASWEFFSGVDAYPFLRKCGATLVTLRMYEWLSEYVKMAPKLEYLSTRHLNDGDKMSTVPKGLTRLGTHLRQGRFDDGTRLCNSLEDACWGPALIEVVVNLNPVDAAVIRGPPSALQDH